VTLVAGAVVLHAVVVEDVAADLRAPAAVLQLAAGGLGDLGLALLLFHLLELGLEDGQRLPRGSAAGSRCDLFEQTTMKPVGLCTTRHGRGHLVDVLPAGALERAKA
jgi:hypothetical protein